MKTKPVAVSKSEQRRIAIQREPDWAGRKDRPPKNPKVPIFPPDTAKLVNRLNEIIETDPERRSLAYALLTRVCVLWTPPYVPEWPKVTVDYVPETGMLHFTTELLRDTVALMQQLFPNGEGLPEPEGCGAL